jgi:hypothetical protein
MLPEALPVLNEVAFMIIGGVIGNRADAAVMSWYRSRFKYEQDNFLGWLEKWNPSSEDLEYIASNPKIARLVGYQVKAVMDEMFEEKLKVWPQIAMAVVANKQMEYDKKLDFILLFNALEIPVLEFMARLSVAKQIPLEKIMRSKDPDSKDYRDLISVTHLAHMGLLHDKHREGSDGISGGTVAKLTSRGQDFMDFIHYNTVD